jgi:putative transposase
MPDDARTRLIGRIRQLPESQLAAVEVFLERLTSPEPPRASTPATRETCWPHAPPHHLTEGGTYFVTAGTLYKRHHFTTAERLDLLQRHLLKLAMQYGWGLEAWAVFSNHYHFVAHNAADPESLRDFLGRLHSDVCREINRLDKDEGRQVWHNFFEKQLTFEKSYLARLNYVHQNPVKHGLVRVASAYRWCSAGWLERTATSAQVRTIYSFKTDKVKVFDDYEVMAPVG